MGQLSILCRPLNHFIYGISTDLFREMHFKWKNIVNKSFVVCLCIQQLSQALFFVISVSVASHHQYGVEEEDMDLEFQTVYKSNVTSICSTDYRCCLDARFYTFIPSSMYCIIFFLRKVIQMIFFLSKVMYKKSKKFIQNRY